jgi:hypothetical protein
MAGMIIASTGITMRVMILKEFPSLAWLPGRTLPLLLLYAESGNGVGDL